jgi:hypothetical protein
VDRSKLWSLSQFKLENIEDGTKKYVQEHTNIKWTFTAPKGTQDDDDVFLALGLDLPIVLRLLPMPNTYTYIGLCLSLISDEATSFTLEDKIKEYNSESCMADWWAILTSADMDNTLERPNSRELLGREIDNTMF